MLSKITSRLAMSGMEGVHACDYLSFYSLRTWGTLNKKFVCDQIYVHDKVGCHSDRDLIVIVIGLKHTCKVK